ncbi:DUF2339 domain-containing protein [Flavisolibacter tropicus]|uniref:DUF2339 domain-containing protein n=1 Tax=Flavisolibacter tropicus TaxID=1492898 RepID=A0A172TUP5_9BACT|nr:DUF2339 domain-containing protein [Flavisolibacter tropicus]ANE50503.1 hypothetical protein SY85_08330 [Flavisolibacter tropicus]
MDDKHSIETIKAELADLQHQVVEQYHKIQELQRQLQRLDPSYKIPTIQNQTRNRTPRLVWENFIGLRLIHLVGIVVLVIGLSIGVKYAIDQELISPLTRIALAYGAGILLFILSLKLKKDYLLFSAILFSGAMASVYFTTYAAAVYYQMLPNTAAFLIMAAFTAFTVIQASSYNRQEIALLGMVGAYGIPFLISRNADRADLFFLYILIIDIGVLYLSYKKLWKTVGRIALTLTWMLFIGWSMMRFNSSQTWIGVVFGTVFFALFTVSILLRRIQSEEPLTREESYRQLVNNIALYLGAIFVLASTMEDQPLAVVTGCFGLFLGVQAWIYHLQFKNEELLNHAHLVASFVLIILFVAMEWDGVSVTFIWLLMAVLLFVWGAWQKMVVLRLGGIGLMGLTLLKLIALDSSRFSTVQKVIAYLTLGALLLIISFFYQKFKQKLFVDNDGAQ